MNKKIDIYVDQINFFSLLKISLNFRKSTIRKILFLDKTYSFGLIFFFRNIKFINCVKFEESKLRIKNKSIYFAICELSKELSDKFFSLSSLFRVSKSMSHCHDKEKYGEFLKEKFVNQAYLPIKLYLFSKKLSQNNKVFYIIQNNPFEKIFKTLDNDYLFYKNLFFFLVYKEKKDLYYNYRYFKFFSPKIESLKKTLIFFKICVKGIFARRPKNNNKLLAIDILQREIDLSHISDLYWLKFSNLKKKNICAISHVKWDRTSKKNLKNFGLENLFFENMPIFLNDFFSIIFRIFFLLFFNLLQGSFLGWLKYNKILFETKLIYYSSIYRKQNIKIYFSMLDVDEDKLIKAQALKNNNALMIQSHWSNYPYYRKDNQKCCDILFTWSKHFIKNNFSYYPFKKIYCVGYPNDHYFKEIKNNKSSNQNLYLNKFVISFMDNIFFNDTSIGKSDSKRLGKLCINLLKTFPNVIFFFKPKSQSHFEYFKMLVPEIKYFTKIGRIKVFFGKGFNEKYNPAKLANISNLVIGMGVSTAAAESSFFGTVSFHYDNLDLKDYNRFCKEGLNQIVFNDVNSLKNAIIKQIKHNHMKIEDNKKYHEILDEFQDGKAGQRTALIIDYIYQNFNGLENLEKLFYNTDALINNNFLFKRKNIL
jgi:hypothetical protein